MCVCVGGGGGGGGVASPKTLSFSLVCFFKEPLACKSRLVCSSYVLR